MTLFANLLVNGIVEGLITAMLALAVVIIFSVGRFANAATGDAATAGAYIAFFLYSKLKFGLVAAAICGALGVAFVTLSFYLVVFRRLAGRPFIASLLASIGVAFVIRHVMSLAVGHDPVMLPLPLVRAVNLGGVYLQFTDLLILGVAVALLVLLYLLMQYSPIGRDMRAISENADLAKVSGIRTTPVLAFVWLVAGAVSGAAGLMISLKASIHPELGWNLLLSGFAGAIVGGLTSLPGAVLGGLLVGISQELSGLFLPGSYKLVTPFVAIALTLLLRPTGIMGLIEKVR